jgi:hypothetical protein
MTSGLFGWAHRVCALSVAIAAVTSASLSTNALGSAEKHLGLVVSSLEPQCTLSLEGGVDFGRVWLTCRGQRYYIAHPSNLAGHVRIVTPAQAMELVRLFSAAERVHVFTDIEDVEVTPAKEDGWLELQEDKFRQCCVPAQVVEVPAAPGGVRSFRVKRTVFWTATEHLYELTQVVTIDGFVIASDRRLLVIDPRQLGMSY